ncbi:MFS transporter [Acetonema longum]|uniref:Putative transporter n=1 Tax=Acetonema longum DSM 6540 TaxID=1009370 RepID=F7NGK5_9FIRM|nr:MFS transporter [Acetonema longum]EGO64809.1 putative transporter [Acetonema longum DSM 6540]
MSTAITIENLIGRMERLPFSRTHKKIFTLIAAGYLFDAYDILLLSFIMPDLARDLALTPVQIGFVFSISFLGMFVGAVLGGMLADYFGRLRVFKYTLLIFSFGTAVTGLVQSYEALLVMRFITGLGMGGEQPVVFTYVSEMMPKQYRGRLNGFTEALWGGGVLLAAGVSFFIVPDFGWRAAFFTGIAPALLIWAMRMGIPESPRWFMIKGDAVQAERQLVLLEQAIERETGNALPPAEPVARIRTVKGNKFFLLFRGGLAQRTIMLWILWFALMFGYWGLNTWLPTLLKQAGYSIYASIGYVFVMNLVWIPSGILGSYLADKVGRKIPTVVYLLLSGITSVVYGWALANKLPAEMMVVCGAVTILFLAGAYSIVFAYTPENYPTEVRGTGTGAANSLGRIGGILAPAVVGFLFPLVGLYLTLALVAMGFVAAGLAVAVLGTETKDKNLESVSGFETAEAPTGRQ